MQFDLAFLNELYHRPPVGDHPPYHGGTYADTEAHVKRIGAALAANTKLDVLIDPNDLESGFATYLTAYVGKLENKGARSWSGIQLYISILAPVAIFGAGSRSVSPGVVAWSDVYADEIGTLPDGDWTVELHAIRACLDKWKIYLATRDEMTIEVPYTVGLANLYRTSPPFRVYDLLFRWDD